MTRPEEGRRWSCPRGGYPSSSLRSSAAWQTGPPPRLVFHSAESPVNALKIVLGCFYASMLLLFSFFSFFSFFLSPWAVINYLFIYCYFAVFAFSAGRILFSELAAQKGPTYALCVQILGSRLAGKGDVMRCGASHWGSPQSEAGLLRVYFISTFTFPV